MIRFMSHLLTDYFRILAKCVITVACLLTPLSSWGQETGEAPAPIAPVQPNPIVYRLAPFDKVSISVYGEPDLETKQHISDSGMAHMPLIGAVELGGKTIAEASEMIEREFVAQEYLRKPAVTINIEEFAPKLLTVMGEVNDPGTVVLAPGVNGVPIQIAVAEVGGFKNTAKTSEVSVTRANPEGEEASTVIVNVDNILSKSTVENQPPFVVRAGDVVFVPRRVF